MSRKIYFTSLLLFTAVIFGGIGYAVNGGMGGSSGAGMGGGHGQWEAADSSRARH